MTWWERPCRLSRYLNANAACAGHDGEGAPRPRGFTLVEILVVLVILGLALSIVAGFMPRGHTSLDLATGAETLAGRLRLARASAIARQQPVLFTVAVDGHGYVLDGVVYALPRSLSIAMAGAPVIRFAPDGSSSGGVVRLAGDGHARLLRVDWMTGRVSGGS